MARTGLLGRPDSDLGNIILGYTGAVAPPTVAVPNIVGMDVATALAALTAVGLVGSGPGAGTVDAENPVAGTVVLVGSTVTYTVGATMVNVPDIVGFSVAGALAALTAVGLVGSGPASGTVDSENPAAGTSVAFGSTVTFTVAAIPPSTLDYYFSPPATTTLIAPWARILPVASRSQAYRALAFQTNYAPGDGSVGPDGNGGVTVNGVFYGGGRWHGPLTDAAITDLVNAGYFDQIIGIDPGHIEQLPPKT
jgi:beta-lactam-binding protein with PASTA domain